MPSTSWGDDWDSPWGNNPIKWGTRDPGTSNLSRIPAGLLDCTTTAIERLYKQFEGRPNWLAVMGVIGDVFQQLEDVSLQMAEGRYISTAVGVQLDEIGRLIGRERNGIVDDEVYRAILRIDAATVITTSTPEEVIEIFRSISNRRVELIEGNAYFHVETAGIPSAIFNTIVDVVSDVPSAGVGMTMGTYDADLLGWLGSTTGDAHVPYFGAFGTTTAGPTDNRYINPVTSDIRGI